jgi:salicylate hydroxylase
VNQKIFHLEDGPEQEARDQSMREGMAAALREARGEASEDEGLLGNANVWADKSKSHNQFSYDADEVAERWWREQGESTIGNVGVSARL